MRNPNDGETTGPAVERRRAVFSHPHRLSAVRCLANADDWLHLADLARDVAGHEESAGRAAAERETAKRGSPDEDAAERIYVDLYHVHLPKLQEAGVVSFDAESRLASMAVDGASVHDWETADDRRDAVDAAPESAE